MECKHIVHALHGMIDGTANHSWINSLRQVLNVTQSSHFETPSTVYGNRTGQTPCSTERSLSHSDSLHCRQHRRYHHLHKHEQTFRLEGRDIQMQKSQFASCIIHIYITVVTHT